MITNLKIEINYAMYICRKCTGAAHKNETFQTNKIAKNIGLCLRSITECKCRFNVITI